MASPFAKLLILGVLIFTSCKKENDFLGNYDLKGPIKYVFDGYGRHEEQDGLDTASLSIVKSGKDYQLKGTEIFEYSGTGGFTSGACLKFVKNGTYPIAIELSGTSLTIPHQFPIQGYGMTISGTGTLENKKLTIKYTTYYRGSYKNSTITSY